MSHLLFDLNIYNYSIDELKLLINLKDNYDYEDIKTHISSIKDKILKLERELKIVGDPSITEAAEEFKLNQLSELEKEYYRIERQRDNLFPP